MLKRRFLFIFLFLSLSISPLFSSAYAVESVVSFAGRIISPDAEFLNLSGITDAEALAFADICPQLPCLKFVDLGNEASSPLSWNTIAFLQNSAPEVDFQYRFSLYGVSVSLTDETIDLRKVPVKDNGAAVAAALPCMKHCTYLDMDSCGVDNEHMAALRDSFLGVKVVWRVWFGTLDYSVRTDVKTILASLTGYGDGAGLTNEASCLPLTYCTEVTNLDVGHNSYLRTLSFIQYMPNLEVFITYENYLRDIDDLKYAKHLRYLELWGSSMYDIESLGECYELTDVMLCGCYNLRDISPIVPAEKVPNLRRLWLLGDHIPPEQVEEFQKNHPRCEVNTWENSAISLWRFIDPGMYNEAANRTPQYRRIVELFHYTAKDCAAYNFSRNDPFCTAPRGQAVQGDQLDWFYGSHHYDPYQIYGDYD